MKIAIIVGGLPPRVPGGTEIATCEIAKNLAKLGHEVHVITGVDPGPVKYDIEQGFYVHYAKSIGIPILLSITNFINTLLIVRRINPDIMHAQMVLLGFHVWLIKKLLKKPYVVYGRGSDIYIYLSPRLRKLLAKLALMDADAVIALTNDMKQALQKLHRREVILIPNGVDIDKFSTLSREEARRKFNIKDNERMLIFVGRLTPIKGVKFLIEAMALIRQQHPEARLLIVGDGEERQNLEELAEKLNLKKWVSFLGQIPSERIPEYMVASDIFVLPSLSEGFPLTILEAMASGLPIVTTRVRGLPEIVKDSENGFLVEPQNPGQIADKVLLVLNDDDLRERMAKNNWQRAKQYSWQNVAKSLEEIYCRVTRK